MEQLRAQLLHRSHSAPSILANIAASPPSPIPVTSTPTVVKQALLGVALYVLVSVIFYVFFASSFKGRHSTHPLVDALYFTAVTLCTVGYGDLVPATAYTKLFTSVFILVGFGFVDILLNGLLTYVLDRQEVLLLSSLTESRRNQVFRTYVMDVKKGRMRIRIKVGLALGVVAGCIALGTIVVRLLEGLDWVDSFYLSVTSVTTVGYGDYAFATVQGRIFAVMWLFVSTLAVARAFLFLTELRMDRRRRRIAAWALHRKITVGDLVAADLDNDGTISKSEFVIYKLKEMGKIAEKDILQICDQFDRLDSGNCGKIRLSDLTESHLY